MPDVTKQCFYNRLIPSLLFGNSAFPTETSLAYLTKGIEDKTEESWDEVHELKIKKMTEDTVKDTKEENVKTDNVENITEKIEKLLDEVKEERENIGKMQENMKLLETKKLKVSNMF